MTNVPTPSLFRASAAMFVFVPLAGPATVEQHGVMHPAASRAKSAAGTLWAALSGRARYVSNGSICFDPRFLAGHREALPGGFSAGCKAMRRPAACRDLEAR